MTAKPKFNRSLTEVRPDAYIFDDGHHFEVRPVQEEDEVIDRTDILHEVTCLNCFPYFIRQITQKIIFDSYP